MTFGEVDEPTPADALALMITGYDLLVKALDACGADGFDAGAAVGFMQAFERFRNGLPVVDNHLIAVAERLDLPTVLCQGNLARVLTSGLGISKVEASRRVRAAEAVGPRTSMLGEPLAPVVRCWPPPSATGR